MASLSERFQDWRPSKTAMFWSCVGSVVVALVLGFTWGGWVTGGTASEMAENAAEEAQAKVAAVVCVDKFMEASDARAQLASLKKIDSSWNQENFIEEGGWAKVSGEEYNDAAEICAEMLMKQELPPAQEALDANVGTTIQ